MFTVVRIGCSWVALYRLELVRFTRDTELQLGDEGPLLAGGDICEDGTIVITRTVSWGLGDSWRKSGGSVCVNWLGNALLFTQIYHNNNSLSNTNDVICRFISLHISIMIYWNLVYEDFNSVHLFLEGFENGSNTTRTVQWIRYSIEEYNEEDRGALLHIKMINTYFTSYSRDIRLHQSRRDLH